MSLLFPDIIDIIPVTRDSVFNVETEGSPSTQSVAYVEEESEIRYNSQGELVDPSALVCLPADAVIAKGDFIKMVKVHGRTPIGDELLQRKVKRATYRGGSKVTHVEVLI